MQNKNNIVYLPASDIAAEIKNLHREAPTIETIAWSIVRRSGVIEIGGAGNLYESAGLIKGLYTLLHHIKR